MSFCVHLSVPSSFSALAIYCELHWPGCPGFRLPHVASDHLTSDVHTLVAACVAGEARAWEEFVRRTQPVVARACLRAARGWGERNPAVIEELVQDTYTKLVTGGLLTSFQPGHPDAIFGFLKVVATRVAHDHCKAMHAEKRGGGSEPLSQGGEREGAEPRAAATAPSAEGEVLLRQIEACVGEFASSQEVNRDLLIFQLYYRLGLSAAAIASIPSLGLSLKGVESFLNRLTRQVREKLGNSGEREKAAHGVR